MSAASVKVILRTRPNKDGTRPLLIQIIKDRKKSIISVNPGKIDPLSPFQIDLLKNDFKRGLKKAC